jgi:hypothetical protein
MVKFEKATQFLGFDYNDYVLIQTALNPFGANNLGLYIAGTAARAAALSALMALTPMPTPGGPPLAIGPQFAWPFHGVAPGPLAVLPLNTAPVQRTLFRVITNDMNVYFVDERLGAVILAFLALNPAAAALGPTAGGWPMPVAVLLEAVIGQYEFERQWVWLFWERAVADADADLHVYMEG